MGEATSGRDLYLSHVHMYIYIYIYIYIYVCVHVCVYMYVQICIDMHVYFVYSEECVNMRVVACTMYIGALALRTSMFPKFQNCT